MSARTTTTSNKCPPKHKPLFLSLSLTDHLLLCSALLSGNVITYLNELLESLVALHQLFVVATRVVVLAAKFPVSLKQLLSCSVAAVGLCGPAGRALRTGGFARTAQPKLVAEQRTKRAYEASDARRGVARVATRLDQSKAEVRKEEFVHLDELLERWKEAIQVDEFAGKRLRWLLATCC